MLAERVIVASMGMEWGTNLLFSIKKCLPSEKISLTHFCMTPILTEELAETFLHVAPKRWRSTMEIWQAHTYSLVSQGAISNRLQKLRAEKLVICRRVGKAKHWRRAS